MLMKLTPARLKAGGKTLVKLIPGIRRQRNREVLE
jgi:hypothetical protein